jgi:hypothetical protein
MDTFRYMGRSIGNGFSTIKNGIGTGIGYGLSALGNKMYESPKAINAARSLNSRVTGNNEYDIADFVTSANRASGNWLIPEAKSKIKSASANNPQYFKEIGEKFGISPSLVKTAYTTVKSAHQGDPRYDGPTGYLANGGKRSRRRRKNRFRATLRR